MASDIVAMRRVTAYRTTDDKLHDTRDEATRHQARMDLITWLKGEGLMEHQPAEDLADALIDQPGHITRLLAAANKGLR